MKKNKRPPYPDPARVQQLDQLITRHADSMIFTMLREGITKKELIEYSTRICARKYLDDLLSNPCPMRLVNEIEDLANFKRMCVHQQQFHDREKYGQSDFDVHPERTWSQGLI
jgi:DNA primase